MEKHIKHRILGMLVIIGLVIILLPLFQGSRELNPETALVKSPPFPDQQATVPVSTAATTAASSQPAITALVPPVMDNLAEPITQNIAPPKPDVGLNQAKPVEKGDPLVRRDDTVASASPVKAKKIDDEGLIGLKNPAWVVQVGSFKNKVNALNIVNQLRANGYRAFLQQTSTALGDSTRVFVGPEKNKKMARALASRLQTEMHLQGVVISYQPLAL